MNKFFKNMVVVLVIVISIFTYIFTKPEKWGVYTDPEKEIGLTLSYPKSWEITTVGDPTDSNGVKNLYIVKKCLPIFPCPFLTISKFRSNQYVGYSLIDVNSEKLLLEKSEIREGNITEIEKVKIAGVDSIKFDNYGKDIEGVGKVNITRHYILFINNNEYSIKYNEPVYLGNTFVNKSSDWKDYDKIQRIIDSIKFKE